MRDLSEPVFGRLSVARVQLVPRSLGVLTEAVVCRLLTRASARAVRWHRCTLPTRRATNFLADGRERQFMAGTRSTRTAAVWRASFDRQVCGIEIGIT